MADKRNHWKGHEYAEVVSELVNGELDNKSRSPLHGFWNEAHNVPSKPRLVFPKTPEAKKKFQRDLRKSQKRWQGIINALGTRNWDVTGSMNWEQWYFDVAAGGWLDQ